MTDPGTDAEEPEYEFFVYDDDEDDPRFSFWMQWGEGGMCLYDRPVDGAGMWLKPERGSDYEPTRPSEDLEHVLAGLITDGIEGEYIADLPPHERYFVSVIHGTIEENPDAIPGPVWSFMHRCEERDRR